MGVVPEYVPWMQGLACCEAKHREGVFAVVGMA